MNRDLDGHFVDKHQVLFAGRGITKATLGALREHDVIVFEDIECIYVVAGRNLFNPPRVRVVAEHILSNAVEISPSVFVAAQHRF